MYCSIIIIYTIGNSLSTSGSAWRGCSITTPSVNENKLQNEY